MFSWLGFNWPMLAILFFSNREIEKRIAYIFDNFGINNFLIWPLFASALIAYLLPQINKFVTKIQDKPNTETIEMSLVSKIKIAKKQQEIAEIEARKKLAEKKEERNIQEGIDQIKAELENTLVQIKIEHQNNSQLTEKINETAKYHAEAQSQLSVEKDARAKLEIELLSVKDTVKSLSEKLISFNNETNKAKAEVISVIRENDDLKKQLPELQSYNKHLIKQLNSISKKAPEFIRLIHKDDRMELEFNSTNYNRVLNAMTDIAHLQFNLNDKKNLMSLAGFESTAPIKKEKMDILEGIELPHNQDKKEIIMDRNTSKKNINSD